MAARLRSICFALSFLALLLAGASLRAQTAPGAIRLAVDASHAPQKILHAHLQIPVHAGPLTLYYPEWIPGEHMPDGPIINLAGLKFMAGEKTVPWRRDLVDMFALHLDVPPGADTLDVSLDFLLSAPASGFSSGASATAFLDVLSWNQVLLYPKGFAARDVTFVPSLTLPAGWKFGTALPGAKQNGDTISFDPVPLTTLVDSPVISGRYFRAIELTPGEKPSHEMDIAADSQSALAMTPEMEMHFHQLVAETGAMFGSRHYRDYHFLLALSDDVAHFGLEHHESSDDQTAANSLTDDAERINFASLLPHEFVHSWNGKFRRPAGLATPDYQQPMKDDLLWVYEGLTEYLGDVLTARSGLESPQMYRETLAYTAGMYDHRAGRTWRPLQDTSDAAVFLYGAGGDWSNWRRGVDFYDEGEMLWLDVDTNLRRITKGRKSIDDFCRAFHGGPGGEPALKPYTFEDVVSALNALAPYDWGGFLRERLDAVSAKTPVEAVESSGWRIVYTEQPNDYQQAIDTLRKRMNLNLSMGLVVDHDGSVQDVVYDGPVYKAGLGPGMKITAVDGRQFTLEALKDSIDAAKSASAPIQLLIANGPQVQPYLVEYHGGLRYPHLEQNNGAPDLLGDILQPRAK